MDDSELSYTLGYYPSHGPWNGEYRPIKVRVKGEGLEVRCRRGYFALAEAPLESGTDRKQLLKEAAERPLGLRSASPRHHSRILTAALTSAASHGNELFFHSHHNYDMRRPTGRCAPAIRCPTDRLAS